MGMLDSTMYRLLLSLPSPPNPATGRVEPPHLLHVKRVAWSESCRRFDLCDIQALVMAPTMVGRVVNLVLGILGGIAVLSGAAWGVWGLGIGAIVSLVFLIPMGINALFGRTCACYLKTAVCTEPLPSLGRLHSARLALNTLKAHTDAAQGGPVPEEELRDASPPFAQPFTHAAAVGASEPFAPVSADAPDSSDAPDLRSSSVDALDWAESSGPSEPNGPGEPNGSREPAEANEGPEHRSRAYHPRGTHLT